MLECFLKDRTKKAIPVTLVAQNNYSAWVAKQSEHIKTWLQTTGFRAEAGSVRLIPDAAGKLSRVLCCLSEMKNFWGAGVLPFTLPEGDYYFDFEASDYKNFALAWGLGAYQFTRYKKPLRQSARLVVNSPDLTSIIESIYWVRIL